MRPRARCCSIVLGIVAAGSAVIIPVVEAWPADGAPSRGKELVSVMVESIGPGSVGLDFASLAQALTKHGAVVIQSFPVAGVGAVDLQLERLRITSAKTQFVVGSSAGSAAFDFDPNRVMLLRGRINGRPQSHVFLAISEWGGGGWIEIGTAGPRFVISAEPVGIPNAQIRLHISRDSHAGGLWPGVPLCGVSPPDASAPRRQSWGLQQPIFLSTQQIELAVETDYEYFQLFGDLDTAAAYVVMLYGIVTDIYQRDVNAGFDLTFVRLWNTPDDLFNEESPIVPFRNYWNDNMQEVHRDVAQFLSGRRNMPYGGAAYLSSLCGGAAYSVVGYITGFFSDPAMPSVNQYDIFVVAHELGHNSGAAHTHNYGIDDCDDFDGAPQRGTIMSYCSQTISGGNANSDLRFHAVVQGFMEEHIFDETPCTADDCNGNSIEDSIDISGGNSADDNINGVPDECEDCNGNGILDPVEIAGGLVTDLNFNLVPDECEPDCNNNTVPDDVDILDGFSTDLYGNVIPDECEEDCDGDGVSDYTQIQADMSLDIDRNAVLDACQDCDGDEISDSAALEGADNVWIASLANVSALGEFHSISGVRVKTAGAGSIDGAQDVFITPDGRILVASGNDDRVVEFDRDAAYVGDLVTAGSGGLVFPSALTLSPFGTLLVCSRDTHSVLEYDGSDGAFIRTLVPSASGGLAQPSGITIGPNGNVFVSSSDQRVLEFDTQTGGLVGDFVSLPDNGNLQGPRGLLFKPDDNLLVASHLGNEVLEYDGVTGAFAGKFNDGGTAVALTMDGPWGIRLGRDGNVYVSRHDADDGGGGGGHDGHDADSGVIEELHLNSTRIYIFDVDNGIFLRSYVMGNDSGLILPTGFDFMPDAGFDCNFNQLPDSCDIASGFSFDQNANGTPDECECPADIDGSGGVDAADLAWLLAGWGSCPLPCIPGNAAVTCDVDLTADCKVGADDLAELLAAWGPCP